MTERMSDEVAEKLNPGNWWTLKDEIIIHKDWMRARANEKRLQKLCLDLEDSVKRKNERIEHLLDRVLQLETENAELKEVIQKGVSDD